jgi:hypothetical protein
MAKYSRTSVQAPPPPRPWAVHPIWRGIGCFLIVIGPVIAFAGAHLLLDMNQERGWYPVPPELAAPFTVPGIGYNINHFFGDLLVGVVLLFIGFALIMVLYAILYSILGPARYGPLDSPPVRGKGRYYRR